MITIAVTGGAACGKSWFCEEMVSQLPEGRSDWFSSDKVVAELLDRDAIQCQIRELPRGEHAFSRGGFERALLRKQVFENSDFREKLEALLHPFVLKRAEAFREERLGRRSIVLLEVPLLYEVEFPVSRDIELVVAASRATQINRITQHRKLSREMGEQILETQLPIETKISRSDLVVWNDGSEDLFRAQVQHLALRCQPYLENDR